MLALVPDTEVSLIERCSGHGGSIGVTKGFHETALKVGRTTARRAREAANPYLASECPLAGAHIVNGMARQAAKEGSAVDDGGAGAPAAGRAHHPIELMARAYGLE